jgi:uncharacterized membrane protein
VITRTDLASRWRRRAPYGPALLDTFSKLAWRAALGAAIGAGLAVAALTLDRAIGWSVPLDRTTVSDLLVTLTGSTVTVAVFALWMRSIVVGLLGSEFHSRIITGFLDDGFQRATAGWMVGAITFLASVTVRLPLQPGDGTPPVTTLVAATVFVTALLGILLAIRRAAYGLDSSEIVHQLADRCLRVLERVSAEADEPRPTGAGAPVRAVDAQGLGWVRDVRLDELFAAVPAETTIGLEATFGSFVSPGQQLLTIDQEVAETDASRLRDAVVIGRTRDAERDLAASIQELTDVFTQGAGAGATDFTKAHDVLRYLDAVLTRLLERGLPSGHVAGPDGRAIIALVQPSVAEHLGVAASRLRRTASDDAVIAHEVKALLGRLSHRARQLEEPAIADAIDAAPRSTEDGDGVTHARVNPQATSSPQATSRPRGDSTPV